MSLISWKWMVLLATVGTTNGAPTTPSFASARLSRTLQRIRWPQWACGTNSFAIGRSRTGGLRRLLCRAALEPSEEFGEALVKIGGLFEEGGNEMVGCSSWLGHFGLAVEDPATYAAAGCALANAGRELSLAGDTFINLEGCSSMRQSALEGAWGCLRQSVNELLIAASNTPGGIEEFEDGLQAAGEALEAAVDAGELDDTDGFKAQLAVSGEQVTYAAGALLSFGSAMAQEHGVRENAGKCLVGCASKLEEGASILQKALRQQ
ncbi:hypothetical protein AAMO2058_001664700 [Amorphochlora amoebiformis]